MAEISRNLLSYKAEFPRWLMALIPGGALLASVFLYFIAFSEVKMAAAPPALIMAVPPPISAPAPQHGRSPASVEPSLEVGTKAAEQARIDAEAKAAEQAKQEAEAKATEQAKIPSNGNATSASIVPDSEAVRTVVSFGIAFCAAAAILSALVLVICLPIFLFSSNEGRVARAGGLVKTTLGFFVGSAGAIIATISFARLF